MAFDTNGALRIIEQSQSMVIQLQAHPAMVPIVREILAPVFTNGHEAPATSAAAVRGGRRPMTAATRRKMRAAAKKRWAEKRKQG